MTYGTANRRFLDEADLRRQIAAARATQLRRRRKYNRELDARDVERHCALDPAGQELLRLAVKRHKLSARAIHRVQKVARTIADLAEDKGRRGLPCGASTKVSATLRLTRRTNDTQERSCREPGRGTNSQGVQEP